MRLRDARYPPREELDNFNVLLVTAYLRDQPYRDEWGTEFRFTLSEDRKHLSIRSAGANRKFESCGDDLATRDGKSICPVGQTVSVRARERSTSLSRFQWRRRHRIRRNDLRSRIAWTGGGVGLSVTITAPVDDAGVEHPEVGAVNPGEGYFKHHPGPNVFITARLLNAPDAAVQLRVETNGGGGSEYEQSCTIRL